MASDEAIRVAALAPSIGMSPLEVLEESDPLRQMAIASAIKARAEAAAEEREDLAIRVANAIGKVLGG